LDVASGEERYHYTGAEAQREATADLGLQISEVNVHGTDPFTRVARSWS
jgi:hypothetical protein